MSGITTELIAHPSDELIAMWRDLHRVTTDSVLQACDPLTVDERKLYDVITKRLIYCLSDYMYANLVDECQPWGDIDDYI